VTLFLSLSPSATQPQPEDSHIMEVEGRLFFAKRGRSSTIRGTARGYEIVLEEYLDPSAPQHTAPSILRLVRVGKFMEGIWIHQERGVWGHVTFTLLSAPQPPSPPPPSPPKVAGHIAGTPANGPWGARLLELLSLSAPHLLSSLVPHPRGDENSQSPKPQAPHTPGTSGPAGTPQCHCSSSPQTYPPKRSGAKGLGAKGLGANRTSSHKPSAAQPRSRSAPYLPHDKELQPAVQRSIRARKRGPKPSWELQPFCSSASQATECKWTRGQGGEGPGAEGLRAEGPKGFVLQPSSPYTSDLQTLRDRTLKRQPPEGPNWAWVDKEEATLTIRLDILALVLGVLGCLMGWLIYMLSSLTPTAAAPQPLEPFEKSKATRSHGAKGPRGAGAKVARDSGSELSDSQSLSSSVPQEIPLESFKAFSQVFAESQASLSSSSFGPPAPQPLNLSTSISTNASTLNPSRIESQRSAKSSEGGTEHPEPSASELEDSSTLEPSTLCGSFWGGSVGSSLTSSTLVPRPKSTFQRVDLVREPEAASLTSEDLGVEGLGSSREQRISDGWMAVSPDPSIKPHGPRPTP